MKSRLILALAALAALALASCQAPAAWEGTPNPLDSPASADAPVGSHGVFGPNWEARRYLGG